MKASLLGVLTVSVCARIAIRPSRNGRELLRKIKADLTHPIKGITVRKFRGMMNYWPFVVFVGDFPEDFGMTHMMTEELVKIEKAVDELVREGKLEIERESEDYIVFRLVEK